MRAGHIRSLFCLFLCFQITEKYCTPLWPTAVFSLNSDNSFVVFLSKATIYYSPRNTRLLDICIFKLHCVPHNRKNVQRIFPHIRLHYTQKDRWLSVLHRIRKRIDVTSESVYHTKVHVLASPKCEDALCLTASHITFAQWTNVATNDAT